MKALRELKSGRLSAMAGVVLCAMAAQATAANLLVNPGFESPPGSGPPAGWTLVEGASRATFQNHTPGGSQMMWLKTFQPIGGGTQQEVGITGGASYTISSWDFFEGSYPNTEATITTQVTWLNDGGGAVGTPFRFDILPNQVGGATANPTGQWLNFSNTAVAPVGATKARVFFGWEGGGVVTGGQSVFIDDLVFDGPGTPPPTPTNDWVSTTSGDWNVANNWFTGTVPNAIDAEANFLSSITVPRTVFSDTAVTVGKLKFNNANQYVIAGPGSLTMDVSTGAATIDVLAGSHKINLPLRLNDNTTATVAAGATLTIADPLTLANGSVLTKAGTGTMEVISTVTTLGPATISTSAGSTNLRFAMGAGVALANSGGETRTFTTQRVSSVNVTGGTLAIDSAGAAKVLVTSALTVGAGKVDVGDNGMVVQGGSASAVRSLITTGRAGGNGIVTTASNAGRAVGYASSTQLGNPTSFMGESFTGAAVLVRYTLLGDTNLTGIVDFDDLVPLAQSYGSTGKEWVHGDFDYDGDVDFDDLVPLAQNYGGSLLGSDELTSLGGADFASDYLLAQSLVPEPTSLIALGAVATLAGVRRRR